MRNFSIDLRPSTDVLDFSITLVSGMKLLSSLHLPPLRWDMEEVGWKSSAFKRDGWNVQLSRNSVSCCSCWRRTLPMREFARMTKSADTRCELQRFREARSYTSSTCFASSFRNEVNCRTRSSTGFRSRRTGDRSISEVKRENIPA